jgi:YgiT-type zinc finger domain-containing protein
MASPDDEARTVAETNGLEGRAAFVYTRCSAAIREDSVKAAFWGPRGLVAIEDIAARVCEGCGEQFYSEETAHRIEEIVHGLDGVPIREITVPVFSLAKPARGPCAG